MADTPQAPRNVSADQVAKAAEPRPDEVRLASAAADETQVRRAYEQFATVYADLGAPGLVSFSQNCAKAVAGDARILDYCLAFDAYAATVAADEPWFAAADARHVELVRAALPAGGDPALRIAEVGRLMRTASGGTAPAAPDSPPVVVAEATPPKPAPVAEPAPPLRQTLPTPPRPVVVAQAEHRPARAKPQRAAAPAKARPAKVHKASAPVRRRAADRCRFEPTPAARALCASPELKAADRRMKRAYERALAAGADRATLDREQAEWRTSRNALASSKDAVARLYDQRIGQLRAHADAPH